MDKIIHYNIAISPKTRANQAIHYEFYSHDKNNAFLTFQLPQVVEDTSVKALFYFTKSKAKWETVGAVEGTLVTVKFDTTLITQDETVTGYLYFKTPTQEADVFQFRLAVKLSKIDREEVYKTHRADVPTLPLEDYVTKVDLAKRLQHIAENGGTYDDTAILRRLAELERRPTVQPYDDSSIKRRLTELERKPTVQPYDDTDVKRRLMQLEQKEVPQYDDTSLKSRLTALERKPETKPYDDTAVNKRLQQLEERTDKDTIYDDTAIKQQLQAVEGELRKYPSRAELDSKGYLTQHQDLSSYAQKSELSNYIAKTDFRPEVVSHEIEVLKAQIENAPKGKLGQNLLANSGNKITNKQYPTTYLSFAQQPTVGKKYTMTVKVDATASKTGVVVSVRNNISLGAFNKVADGIYSTTFDWKPNPSSNPYELVVYQPPNNGAEASLVWAKFVEGIDTDYTWYPNYNEVSNVYTFAEEASTAIESSANLLDDTYNEKVYHSEFASYADITKVIDTYGTGKYTLSFDAKTGQSGNLGVYISGTGKYTFLQETIATTLQYKRYTLHLDMKVNDANATKTALSFFGGKYGNGVVPSIKRLRLSKGIYNELPWKPSDNELTALYEKILGGQ